MKNLLGLLLVIFVFASCTKEIYRGEVIYIDENNRKLVQLFGTNQAIWTSAPEPKEHDLVQVETTNNFKSTTVDVICSPTNGHCHYTSSINPTDPGYGLHTRIHIRKVANFDYDDPDAGFTYRTKRYVPATGEFTNRSTIHELWIESTFDFNNPYVYAILMEQNHENHQIVNDRKMVLEYTREDHSHN